ncbi:hypothetical protein F53441_13794 [Fusarium austroafricanum]|uniref:Chromo domain-containing protein n=1 Tax=Fusarium austroafricanum TaxID=2364996 RepID=A0A8H4NPH2_9HYPO|nr:hypothetical protein F53441_13794 [Fusarium austroafricanum]
MSSELDTHVFINLSPCDFRTGRSGSIKQESPASPVTNHRSLPSDSGVSSFDGLNLAAYNAPSEHGWPENLSPDRLQTPPFSFYGLNMPCDPSPSVNSNETHLSGVSDLIDLRSTPSEYHSSRHSRSSPTVNYPRSEDIMERRRSSVIHGLSMSPGCWPSHTAPDENQPSRAPPYMDDRRSSLGHSLFGQAENGTSRSETKNPYTDLYRQPQEHASVIREVMGYRTLFKGQRHEYLVHWAGYPYNQFSWVSKETVESVGLDQALQSCISHGFLPHQAFASRSNITFITTGGTIAGIRLPNSTAYTLGILSADNLPSGLQIDDARLTTMAIANLLKLRSQTPEET